jgi:glycosyltransferase involved in cell wall biosynthesis
MRVLFATNHAYLPQRFGGAESSTHDLCAALRQRDVPVAVLAETRAGGFLGWRNSLVRRATGRRFPKDHAMGYPVYRGWSPVDGVAEALDDFRPTVAVIQAGFPLTLAQPCLAAGVPTIVYLRDTRFDRLGARPKADDGIHYVANSRFTAARFESAFALSSRVLPPLVIPERYRTPTSRTHCVFVNPYPEKGVDIAFTLAERHPQIPFDFFEAWPLTPERRTSLLTRARAARNIDWHAPLADARLIYRRAKLVLMPSRWEEGWGRVATEAQINGIPVLASDAGGLPESVGPGGLLISLSAEINEWSKALKDIWDNDSRYAELSALAALHAGRKEIQPAHLLARFIELIEACSRPTAAV